jgi:hypothetical protein
VIEKVLRERIIGAASEEKYAAALGMLAREMKAKSSENGPIFVITPDPPANQNRKK